MSERPKDGPPPTAEGDRAGETPQRASAGIPQLVRDLLGIDRAAVAILVTVPVSLTVLEYYGMPWHYTRHQRPGRQSMHPVRDPPLAEVFDGVEMPGPIGVRPYLWWGLGCLLFMVLVPMLVGWLAGRSPRALGVRVRGTGRDAWTYLLLFAIFFPVIWLVSQRADFQHTYPFYKPPGKELGQDFLIFQLVYCFQFFAIEFFFRGFIVLGLKRALGWASVLVMLAPYCMIHYYKPMPEALGAIGAGLVLGALAWRTGTIVYGWFLHYAVALSMDLLALHQTGRL